MVLPQYLSCTSVENAHFRVVRCQVDYPLGNYSFQVEPSKMISSHQISVLLLCGKTQNKTVNADIRSGVHKSFNNKRTGRIIVPLLIQKS